MNKFALVFALVPSIGFADDISIASQVSDVTLYPYGATVVRHATYQAAAGDNRLIITDLPASTPLHALRMTVEGAKMGAVTLRQDYVPPRTTEEPEALVVARAEVKRIEAAIVAQQDVARGLLLAEDAADARIEYLRQIGQGEGLEKSDLSGLREIGRMIGEETLAAKQEALKAEIAAREIDTTLEELGKDLVKAQQAVKALVPEVEARAYVAVDISSDTETSGQIAISYVIQDASWEPVYDIRLVRGDNAELTLSRGAFVRQNTGENWQDVKLALSTVRPSEQTEPSMLWPTLRRIEDPSLPQPKVVMRSLGQAEMSDMAAAPEPVLEQATASFDGISVTYNYPGTIALASSADAVRIALGELKTSAKLQALAVPRRDLTAFLMADLVNDTGELILPSSQASFYLDDRFVGTKPTPMIAAGDEAKLSFGPIEGLRLSRNVLSKSEGDRGVLSKSNQQIETAKLEVQNLTSENWNMRVLDQVPYSEQDDLKITWTATPRPTEVDVDDLRGILAWEFEIRAGEKQAITLEQTTDWPIDKTLR